MTPQQKLKSFAKKHLGKPYKFGAKPYQAPKFFDCSSYVQYLYKKIGINLPRTALDQAAIGNPVSKENIQTGDLIFIKGGWGHYNPQFPEGIGHVSMYLGNGKIIHAKHFEDEKGKNIGKVLEEEAKPWLERKDLIIIKRIILN